MPESHKIPENASVDNIWEELTWFQSRASVDPDAKELVAQVVPLLERVEQVRVTQYRKWQAELLAQASVDYMDTRLDVTIRELDQALLTVASRNRKSPRYTRYFSNNPSAVIRMGLEAELGRVAPWVQSLKTEAEPELRAFGERLEKDIADSRGALEQRISAAAANADHRVREIVRLVDDTNRVFLALSGALVQKAAEKNYPRDWPSGFFRHHHHQVSQIPVLNPVEPTK
jgi:hypothetical protein